MTASDRAFAARAVRRARLFLTFSIAGLGVAAALSLYYATCKLLDPSFEIGARLVIVVLILLNSRQNLRQYRFARILEKVGAGAE